MPGQMPDLSRYDLNKVSIGKEQIREILHHRYEFEQVDAVHACDVENICIVGSRQLRKDEFWVRGHFPGAPVFPGVLMLEACGQLCAILYKVCLPAMKKRIAVFAGADRVRFRGKVSPGDRLILVGKSESINPRGFRCDCWALSEGKVVMEGQVFGVTVASL